MKSIQFFLFIIVIGFCFLGIACVREYKPVHQKTETPASQKEKINPPKKSTPLKSTPLNKPQKIQDTLSTANVKTVVPSNEPSLKNKINKKASVEKASAANTKEATKVIPVDKESSLKNRITNTRQTEKERLKAIQTFDKRSLTPADYTLLKSWVQDEKETLKIRQEALKKIYKPVGEDEEMLDYLLGVLQSKNNLFKKDALYALQTIKYSSGLFQKKQGAFLSALKEGLYNTTDKKTYHILIKALHNANDPFAHELAIDLLKQEDFSKLSARQLLQLLQKNVRPQHYPTLHRIMQNTQNMDIKTELITLLAQNENSRAQLIQYLGNSNQDIKTRLACADALMEIDKSSFYIYTKNVIWNKEDDLELRRKCLALINKVDTKTLKKYVNIYDDMSNMGLSDNTLNQLREALLKKLDKNQY